jgi:Tol biopolymer transport system component
VNRASVMKRVAVLAFLGGIVVVLAVVWRVPQRLTHGALCIASNSFDSAGGSPAWSPDGTTIAFRKGQPHSWLGKGIWLVHADGTGLRLLTHPSSCYGDDGPAWSPDGRRLAVDDGHGISLINVRDGGRRKLVSRGNDPTWSADGRWIAFAKGGVDKTRLYVVRADGTGLRRIDTSDTQVFHPSWSPDGSMIVFAGNRSGLYVARVSGGRRRQISDDREADNPAWSPDGKRIAFSEDCCVLLRNASRGGRTSLVYESDSDEGETDGASWSPDGRRIAFFDGDVYIVNADGTGLHRIADL